jgi:ribosomal protein L30E
MTIKDIKDAIDKNKAVFGLRETIKACKKNKGKYKVFVVSDARPETVKKLQDAKIDTEKIKAKEEVEKELQLGFLCEVFLVE